jgi:hypothetical protein
MITFLLLYKKKVNHNLILKRKLILIKKQILKL